MSQAETQVNVLSPVIFNVVEVDAFHYVGRQYCDVRNWRGQRSSTGVLGIGMAQDGNYVNLGEPSASFRTGEYWQTSQKRRVCRNGLVVVGLPDSTPSLGKPSTWGSGQRYCDKLGACHPGTRRLGLWRR